MSQHRLVGRDRICAMNPDTAIATQLLDVNNTLARIAHAVEAIAKQSVPDFKTYDEATKRK